MKEFDKAKKDIIEKLLSINYSGDFTDLGNEIGIAIAKYTMIENAYSIGLDKESFISGIEHGISLINKTH